MTFVRLCLPTLTLWLAGCALLPFGPAQPPGAADTPPPAVAPVVVAPVVVQPVEAAAEAPAPVKAPAPEAAPKPLAKAPVPKAAAPRPEVDCQSQRSGRGDDEKTTLRCTNHSAQPRTVFLKLDAIGVSGIPTVASEKAGHRLAPGETRVLATLTVISRPAQVRFSFSVAP